MAYVPTNTRPLNTAPQQQIRLGIQGAPGTGKTWAALTFPNPIVIDIDRGLGAHQGRSDVIQVPFYDTDFVKTILPQQPYNIKDALTYWLEKEARKLEPDQTLILDGLTGLASNYHTIFKRHPKLTDRGEVDYRAEWGLKIQYFSELTDILISLRCNVILISHEAEAKEKDGTYRGKIRPLLTGQFGDQIVSKFTDWVRQLAADKPTGVVAADKLANWNMTQAEFTAMTAKYPRNTLYFWQLESDDIWHGKVSSLVGFPRYIPANYESFIKWRKK